MAQANPQASLSAPLPAAPAPLAQDQTRAALLGTLSVAAFALTLPCTKLLTGPLGALQIGLYRALLAALVALAILVLTRAQRPGRAQVKRLLLMSTGLVYGFPILSAVGMQQVPVGHGGVVLAALPLATAVFASVIARERCPALFWFSAVAGLAAVALFATLRGGPVGGGLYLGDLALLGAVLAAGYGYAQGGLLARQIAGWQVTCWALVLNLPLLLALVLLLALLDWPATQQLAHLSALHWGALAFLAFVNSLLAFFSWNRALALGGIQRISQLQLLQPFFTYGYAIALMGEALDPLALLICAAVIALVLLSRKALARR